MVKEELIENGQRVRHWSDKSLRIRQVETGAIYDDAVDVLPCRYSYEETEEEIATPPEAARNDSEGEEDAATVEDYAAALRELGVGV